MNQPIASIFDIEPITKKVEWIMSQLSQQFKWLICNVPETLRRGYYNNNFMADENLAYFEVLIYKARRPKDNDIDKLSPKAWLTIR